MLQFKKAPNYYGLLSWSTGTVSRVRRTHPPTTTRVQGYRVSPRCEVAALGVITVYFS